MEISPSATKYHPLFARNYLSWNISVNLVDAANENRAISINFTAKQSGPTTTLRDCFRNSELPSSAHVMDG